MGSTEWLAAIANLLTVHPAGQPRPTARQAQIKVTSGMRVIIDAMDPEKEYSANDLCALTGLDMDHIKNRIMRLRQRGLVVHRVILGKFYYRKAG